MEANLSNLIASRFRSPHDTVQPYTNHHENHAEKHSHQKLNNDTVSISQQAQLAYSQQQTRQSSIEITTRDGDKVTISLTTSSSYQASFSYSDFQSQKLSQTEVTASVAKQSSLHYQFSVEGNLDNDERQAIEDLVKDISKVADNLYQGDINAAFKQATSLQYNTDEIGSYAFNFTQTNSRQYTAVYEEVAKFETEVLSDTASKFKTADLIDALKGLAENRIKDLNSFLKTDQIQSLIKHAAYFIGEDYK